MLAHDTPPPRDGYPTSPLGYPSELLRPGETYGSVTETISSIVLTRRHPKSWMFGFAVAFALVMMLLFAISYLFYRGVGIWGINIPVAWGFAIVNFVWWIGIGHAGTFISAILLLLLQKWRTSINRFTEAMTLFAVACAAMFPLLHLGRPWVFFWSLPYPDTMGLWPQFRSPLVWDVFAVGTYFTVSLIFWYAGLIPDLATLRDRAQTRAKQLIYGFFALGWRGSAVHWQRHQSAYLLLAGLSTPLVLSVHSVVSFDNALSSSRQSPAGFRDVLDVREFLAGAGHLLGEPSAGNRVVPAPHRGRMEVARGRTGAVPFLHPVLPAAVSGNETTRRVADDAGGGGVPDAHRQCLLAGDAVVSPHGYSHSLDGFHGTARCGRALDGNVPRGTEAGRVTAKKRSARRRGGGLCDLTRDLRMGQGRAPVVVTRKATRL
jgi:molybdopterin-containing oxidoreductase family membrane subunit